MLVRKCKSLSLAAKLPCHKSVVALSNSFQIYSLQMIAPLMGQTHSSGYALKRGCALNPDEMAHTSSSDKRLIIKLRYQGKGMLCKVKSKINELVDAHNANVHAKCGLVKIEQGTVDAPIFAATLTKGEDEQHDFNGKVQTENIRGLEGTVEKQETTDAEKAGNSPGNPPPLGTLLDAQDDSDDFDVKLENFLDKKLSTFESNIERKLESKLESEFASLEDALNGMSNTLKNLRRNLKVGAEDHTCAWVSQYVYATTGQEVPPGSFSNVMHQDLEGFMKPYAPKRKDGSPHPVNVELDCYGVHPVHAVAEYKSTLTSEDVKKGEDVLDVVRLFVRKVEFLEKTRKDLPRPIAFFCVSELDPDLYDPILSILQPVGGILVSNMDKRNPAVFKSS